MASGPSLMVQILSTLLFCHLQHKTISASKMPAQAPLPSCLYFIWEEGRKGEGPSMPLPFTTYITLTTVNSVAAPHCEGGRGTSARPACAQPESLLLGMWGRMNTGKQLAICPVSPVETQRTMLTFQGLGRCSTGSAYLLGALYQTHPLCPTLGVITGQ